MLLCGEVDKGAGRVVWLWSWVVFPVVWPTVDGLAPVLWAGGVTVGGGGLGPVLGLIVASVTGAAVCDLLGVARAVTRVWAVGLVEGVLSVVTREAVPRIFMVVCVVRVSEVDVVTAI